MESIAPSHRPSRYVAAGRLLLTTATLLAFAFDTAFDGTQSHDIVLRVLLGYLAYAAIAVVLEWVRPTPALAARVTSHAIDLGTAAALNLLVDGTTSPFFALFIFVLFSASLRLGVRGVVLTGAILLSFYVALAVIAYSVPQIDLTRFVVRSTYLVVVIVLLTYLTTHEQLLRDRMTRLALWPREWQPQFGTFVESVVRRAGSLARADRVVLVWEDGSEPWLYVAALSGGKVSIETEPPQRYDPLVAPEIESASFLVRRSSKGLFVQTGPGTGYAPPRHPVHPALVERFGLNELISSPFGSDAVRGRVFFAARKSPHYDDAVFCEIVTRLIGLSLEQHLMIDQLKQAAVTDERIRLARDLHDGVVQSLAGMNLHLHVLDRLIEASPDQARRTLAEIHEALTADQRELRAYIAQLRPINSAERESSLGSLLEALARRVEREWGVKVSTHVDGPVELASAGMREEVYRIVREAVTNAAKHASASAIEAFLRLRGDRVSISVRDDGRGLPFHGRFTLAELQTTHRGPITLKERVAAVGGDLVLESTDSGTTIDILVPLSLLEVQRAHSRFAG